MPRRHGLPPATGILGSHRICRKPHPVGTTVYLDLNSLSSGGQTGRPYRGVHERLIAVIYSEIDGQWVNINAELLRWGLEEYPDHDWLQYIYFPSECDPYEWLEESYPYVRGFVERRDVMVSILPDEKIGGPGENVTFKVFIKNTGNVEDTYSLIAEDAIGWNPMLTDNLIEDVAPKRVRTTALTVTIPGNAENGTQDYITVIATSLDEKNVDNSAGCIVTAAE